MQSFRDEGHCQDGHSTDAAANQRSEKSRTTTAPLKEVSNKHLSPRRTIDGRIMVAKPHQSRSVHHHHHHPPLSCRQHDEEQRRQLIRSLRRMKRRLFLKLVCGGPE